MKRLAYVIVAVLLMALAGGSDRSSAMGVGEAELKIAHEFWHASPTNCTSLSVEFDALNMQLEAAGEATQPEYPQPCIMRIAPDLGVLDQCEAVVHEWGHWLGYGHSDNPRDVMYYTVTTFNIPTACRQLRLDIQRKQSRKQRKPL